MNNTELCKNIVFGIGKYSKLDWEYWWKIPEIERVKIHNYLIQHDPECFKISKDVNDIILNRKSQF